MLFAETSDGGMLFLTAIVGIAGSAITWAATWYVARRAQKRKEAKEDEDDTISKLNKLLERVDRDRKECVEEGMALRKEIEEIKDKRIHDIARVERAIAWIRHLEYMLDRNNLPYPKWNEEGSSTHVPLPPTPDRDNK